MHLLPSELINNSINAYIYEHSTNSQKIYWVMLFTLTAIFVSLPLIYVDVSIQNIGTIRPVAEKVELKAGISEFIDSVYTKEGSRLNKGDTLLTFCSSGSNHRINYQQDRITDFQKHISDLHSLIKGDKPTIFSSDVRQQEYIYFIKQKKERETNLDKATKYYERNKSLFEKKIISEEEFELYQYEYTKAKDELATLIDNQISIWQTDLNTYTNSCNEMLSTFQQEFKDKDLYIVTCPVNGTLDQFRGIYKGCNIQAGTPLAVISPDSTLYVEAYVSPRNIGYLHINMPVNIQVESFNYNEWGVISGKITEISSDFFTDNINGTTFYKVKCSINKNHLIRKNGVKGTLKKGMPLICHFMITRRSLFDLLYQKVDDWANPTQYKTNMTTQAT